MKDSLCYIYFSCNVYWNLICWRHMSATSSDVRKYTCIYGCVRNDAWGSPCESTVCCRITVPATFFLTRMAHEHATTWVHETSFCVLFLYGYIYIYIYIYLLKNKISDTCTHIHISDKRDFTLLSILSASSAAQLSNGSMCLLSSAVKTTGRDYRCFFLSLIALWRLFLTF